MATDPVPQIEEAIGRGLEDFCALIKEFEALRGTMVFEDEPATFEAALRAEAEPEA